MARQEKIHISKRGIITGTAAAAVLLAVNIGVGSFLYSQHKALDTASNEPAEVSEYEVKEAPVQTTAAAEQTVTETTATTAKEKTERTTTAKNQKEAKTTTVVKQDKQTAVTTAAKNSNQTAATTAAPKSTAAAPKATTAAPKVTTAAPKTTTAKRTTTTAKHTTTTAKQTTAAPTTTTAVQKPPVTDRLTYNLVPADKTGWTPAYENDLANNVYRAQPGEEIRVDVTVKNDPGARFVTLAFDFGAVQLLRTEKGPAYEGQYGPSLIGNDDQSLENVLDFSGRSGNMYAADDSVLGSFYIKVPQEAGRYTIMPDGSSCKVSQCQEDKSYTDINFTFYGLDILVGDTPMPEKHKPITSEPYYRANERAAKTEPAYDMDVPKYGTPEEAGSTMAFCTENITAHAGDKHVPVRVFVQNNMGFSALGLRIQYDPKLIVNTEVNRPVFAVDPAFETANVKGALNTSNQIIGFGMYNLSDEDFSANGTLLTFYVDIPDDAAAGDVFSLETRLVEVRNLKEDAVLPICTVNGSIRITG